MSNYWFQVTWGFPGSSAGKESACNAGDPGSGKPPREGIGYSLQLSWASLMAQTVKNLPAMWKTWVQSLGQEDPLEERMAAHPSILAWRIPWTEEPGGLQSMGSQRAGHDLAIDTSTTDFITTDLFLQYKTIILTKRCSKGIRSKNWDIFTALTFFSVKEKAKFTFYQSTSQCSLRTGYKKFISSHFHT